MAKNTVRASGQSDSTEAKRLASLPIAEVKDIVGFRQEGLSSQETTERLSRYGPNELPEEKSNPLLKFLSYFWGPIPWMIEAAAVFSALVRHWEDLAIILVLLLVNAIIGFWEEYQAGNTIAALKAKLAITARVKRGGAWTALPARELVPGDIIRLRIGDIIPADARLLDGDPIEVDQSALTGESLPVTHASGDAVYSGSIVKQGEIEALVYGTGNNTYFGRTAQLVGEVYTRSHFQQAVLHIGNYLIVLAVILVVLIIAVALFREDPILTTLLFRSRPDDRRHPRCYADSVVGDHGRGSSISRRQAGHREPPRLYRGTGRGRRLVFRQDRYSDAEQAHGRSKFRPRSDGPG